ncbi:unnamed protein product [Phyllotreta striolata]|uniref:Uncharacterized protein n=1 Tax=Phyllotreta striolata TaxID=444603 RepID=A0A9N9TVG6_PHYSR|nr:unnamed protein product [Phyllotreta striolata]
MCDGDSAGGWPPPPPPPPPSSCRAFVFRFVDGSSQVLYCQGSLALTRKLDAVQFPVRNASSDFDTYRNPVPGNFETLNILTKSKSTLNSDEPAHREKETAGGNIGCR